MDKEKQATRILLNSEKEKKENVELMENRYVETSVCSRYVSNT